MRSPLWMYMRKVRPDHRPCFMMIVSLTLCSFIAIAPPARRECAPIKSGSIHCLSMMRSNFVITRICLTTSEDWTQSHVPSGWQNLQRSESPLPPFDRIWCTRLTNAWVGPFGIASCMMQYSIRPFFWACILSVTVVAHSSSFRVIFIFLIEKQPSKK